MTSIQNNIYKQQYIGNILCAKVRVMSTKRTVYRARGMAHKHFIKPMKAELSEFKNFKTWVQFVKENWVHDGVCIK